MFPLSREIPLFSPGRLAGQFMNLAIILRPQGGLDGVRHFIGQAKQVRDSAPEEDFPFLHLTDIKKARN